MGAAGPGCWVRGRAGRGGGWERESEPVDEPTLLEESEPERQGKKRRRGTEKEEGEEEGGRRDRRLSLQLCVKTCNIHHALMVESKAGQRSCCVQKPGQGRASYSKWIQYFFADRS